jgi:hypothetical protein
VVLQLHIVSNATEEYDGTLGQPGGNLGTAKMAFCRLWNSNSRFSFWWTYTRNWKLQHRRI